jgi:hypothetical protein
LRPVSGADTTSPQNAALPDYAHAQVDEIVGAIDSAGRPDVILTPLVGAPIVRHLSDRTGVP